MMAVTSLRLSSSSSSPCAWTGYTSLQEAHRRDDAQAYKAMLRTPSQVSVKP